MAVEQTLNSALFINMWEVYQGFSKQLGRKEYLQALYKAAFILHFLSNNEAEFYFFVRREFPKIPNKLWLN